MKINLPKSAKAKIKAERDKVFDKMTASDITQKEWEALNVKYTAYSNMMKKSLKITPDTLLVVGAGLLQTVLILNFEKLDIVRSKAINFVLKGRV